ncbi:MAG TPA: lamin tail domain-containing protein [Dehalococcoidia bacterium]|nr:lamin tail domain-containing protein [Dehalococcoidia bacterium]
MPTPTLPAGSLAAGARFIISEVLFSPTEGSESAGEWVELYNPTDQAIDLAGWSLADNYSAEELPPLIVGPRSYVVVAGSVDAFLAAHLSFSGSVIQGGGGRIGNGLANDADMVVLADILGALADSVNWGKPQPSWPGYHSAIWDPGLSPPASGFSLARTDGREEAFSMAAWASSSRPSPGQANPTSEPAPTATATPGPAPTPTPTPNPGAAPQIVSQSYLPALSR